MSNMHLACIARAMRSAIYKNKNERALHPGPHSVQSPNDALLNGTLKHNNFQKQREPA